MTGLIALLQLESGSHDGPWMKPKGSEAGAKMYPKLSQGEEVVIEVDRPMSYHQLISLTDDFTPLDLAGAVRYRARKFGGITLTTVEIMLNGANDGKAST